MRKASRPQFVLRVVALTQSTQPPQRLYRHSGAASLGLLFTRRNRSGSSVPLYLSRPLAKVRQDSQRSAWSGISCLSRFQKSAVPEWEDLDPRGISTRCCRKNCLRRLYSFRCGRSPWQLGIDPFHPSPVNAGARAFSELVPLRLESSNSKCYRMHQVHAAFRYLNPSSEMHSARRRRKSLHLYWIRPHGLLTNRPQGPSRLKNFYIDYQDSGIEWRSYLLRPIASAGDLYDKAALVHCHFTASLRASSCVSTS